MKIITESEKETVELGKRIGEKIVDACVIAFFGDLGAGKTHFVSGIAQGLGYNGETYSPTFALVNEYIGGRLPMYHFDMYRISGWEDLYSTGFFEYADTACVIAVEWSENIAAALPEETKRITITRMDDNKREIILEGFENI